MIASLNRPVRMSNALSLTAAAGVLTVVGFVWYGLESLADENQNLQRMHQQDLRVIDHLNQILGVKTVDPVAHNSSAPTKQNKGQPVATGSYAITLTRYSAPVTGRIISTGPR